MPPETRKFVDPALQLRHDQETIASVWAIPRVEGVPLVAGFPALVTTRPQSHHLHWSQAQSPMATAAWV